MCQPSPSLCQILTTVLLQAWVPSQHNEDLGCEGIFWLDSHGVSGNRKQCSLLFIACPGRPQGLIWYLAVMYSMAMIREEAWISVLDSMRLFSHCQDECLQAVLRLSLKQKTLWGFEGVRVIVCLLKEISVRLLRLLSLSYKNLQNSFLLVQYFACDGDKDAQRSCSYTLPSPHNQAILWCP